MCSGVKAFVISKTMPRGREYLDTPSSSESDGSSLIASESEESEEEENLPPASKNQKKEGKKASPLLKGSKSKQPKSKAVASKVTSSKSSLKKRPAHDSDSEDLMDDDDEGIAGGAPVAKAAAAEEKGPALKKKRAAIPDSDDDEDGGDTMDEERKSEDFKTQAAPAPVAVEAKNKSPEKIKKSSSMTSTKVAAKKSPPKKAAAVFSSSSSSSSSAAAAVTPAVNSSATVMSFAKLSAGGTADAQEEDITRGPEVTTENAAKKLILRYMKQQNRPYSAIQVFENLHKRVMKGTVERVLESLAKMEGSSICVKEYGKNKIYWPDQKGMPTASADQLRSLDDQIKAKSAELRAVEARGMDTERSLKVLLSQPSDADLDRVLAEKEAIVADLQSKADALSKHSMDPQALLKSIRKHNHFRKRWLELKSGCMDIVENIAEAMEKKTAAVAESMGVETDKDMGVSPPALVPEPK